MRRQTALVIPLVMAATWSLTGCCYYELRNTLDSTCASVRCCWDSHMAWHEYKHNCGDMPYKSAYGHGFRDGYSAVCQGQKACAPTLPPRCYWDDCYSNGGKQKVAAYFNGYSQGAYVAQANGLSGCGRLAFCRPVYGSGAYMGSNYGMPAGTATTAPAISNVPPAISAPSPPPPAPPVGGPAIPSDRAYETYDPGGLYNE